MSKTLKKGSRVVYRSFNKNEFATVLNPSVKDGSYDYTVEDKVLIRFDNQTLIPNVMVVPKSSLYIILDGVTYINIDMLDCTCGLKFIRDGGQHSFWCDLYSKKL